MIRQFFAWLFLIALVGGTIGLLGGCVSGMVHLQFG